MNPIESKLSTEGKSSLKPSNKIFMNRFLNKESNSLPPILRLIRKFILATSFPPLIQFYWALYRIPMRLAFWIFRKYPAIKAVYLRRGCAKGEGLPGVSDIDFALIANSNEWGSEDIKELHHTYEKFARVTVLLDKSLEVYDEEAFYKQYETNHYCHYRFTEGRETWQLLYGKDYLADLPALPIEKMYVGFFTEIKVWWALFAQRFFQGSRCKQDTVTRNTTCYKVVGEIVKMKLAMNHDMIIFRRSEALKLAKQHLNVNEKVLVDKLETIAKRRFLDDDEAILDETKDFLLTYLNRLYVESWDHLPALSLKKITPQVDCPGEECFWTQKDRTGIEELVEYVKEQWQETCRGAYIALSVFFNMDDLLLMLEIDPKRFPTVHQLSTLNLLHWDLQTRLRRRIHLFLLFPSAAFRIDSDDLKQSWQSILCPPSNPDLFELLNRPEFIFDGGGYCATIHSIWTLFVESFFQQEKRLFYERLEDPSIYKLNALDFLRIFWKTAQVVLVNRSVQTEQIHYPLTLPAIQRGLNREGIPLPSSLQILTDAYLNELAGRASDITDLIPAAIDYLKEIGL